MMEDGGWRVVDEVLRVIGWRMEGGGLPIRVRG